MNIREMLKKGKPIKDGPSKDAKVGLLKELQKVMGDSMTDDIKGLKKITVAAPSKDGLAKGLEHAKELIDEDKGSDEEVCEEEVCEEEVSEDKSSEDKISSLESKLAKLQSELEMLKSK